MLKCVLLAEEERQSSPGKDQKRGIETYGERESVWESLEDRRRALGHWFDVSIITLLKLLTRN